MSYDFHCRRRSSSSRLTFFGVAASAFFVVAVVVPLLCHVVSADGDSRMLSEAAEDVQSEEHSTGTQKAAEEGHGEGGGNASAHDAHDGEEHSHAYYAIIFPVFVLNIGVVVYYALSRYCHFIPYTAAMFAIGIFMGVAAATINKDPQSQLDQSIEMWAHIDSHTLLMTFLPGLLFKDAFGLNVHLFAGAIGQCLIMAFPEVLAGTTLVALVGFYVLPYHWPWFFCLAFGAILSATDPVAVAALLNEVGAPPRLKTHIAGEALLNDGSAMVFFVLFAEIAAFNETDGEIGVDHSWGTGIALFFKMSLGAACIGFCFGLALTLILWLLKRRYNFEENVVQVMATLAIAYVTYYAAEVPGTSGVIAVVTCGIVAKAFADSMINDHTTMRKFWDLLEHVLNTVLFALGGAIWGIIISNGEREWKATGRDWGYLFALYALATVIRTFVVFSFYPLVSRIGLKSSWQEAVFISWGGLRGAVGIALAIFLDNGGGKTEFTTQVFFMVGGMAFLTLFVNGMTAGPLLLKLGLADTAEARTNITDCYRKARTLNTLKNLLHHLGDSQFKTVDFAVIRQHVPHLQEITDDELKIAVKFNMQQQPAHEYSEPALWSLLPFVSTELADHLEDIASISPADRLKSLIRTAEVLPHEPIPDEVTDSTEQASRDELVELRKAFVEMLQSAFEYQIDTGLVDTREARGIFAIRTSLESVGVAVSNGKPLNDVETHMQRWEKIQSMVEKLPGKGKKQTKQRKSLFRLSLTSSTQSDKTQYWRNAKEVRVAFAYINNHKLAQKSFKEAFCNSRTLTHAESTVLNESNNQILLAEEFVATINPADVQSIMNHILCNILLNAEVEEVGKDVKRGLLRDPEAEHEIEHISDLLRKNDKCDHKCGQAGSTIVLRQTIAKKSAAGN